MFNGENELTGVDSTATYGYDGHRWRVEKTVSGTTTTYIYSGTKVIAEYSGGSLSKEYVYSGNRLLATIVGASVTYHYPDQLSNRLETDASGNVVRTFGHLPFGDVWYETGAADKWKFTGYERDNQSGESGLDYALNRFYSSAYGRFQSPDLLDGNPGNPQSWNHYAYVQNDPGNLLDPSGLHDRPVAAPANTGCAAGPLYGCPIWGDDIFDALAGAPGTFLTLDQYGNLGFGFDPEQWITYWQNQNENAANNPPQNTPESTDCEQKILDAVNREFGTSFTTDNVETEFQFSEGAPPGQGTFNLDISVPPQDQPDGVSPGRYPQGALTYIFGIGSTLHIPAGPGGLDSPLTLDFSSSQFTAHLDSAFPYNPVGLLFHFLKDVLGIGGHNPCP